MYRYTPPTPVIINLGYNANEKDAGYRLRERAYNFVRDNRTQGAQAANDDRQGYGILAEIVVREKLNLIPIEKDPHPLGFDIKSNHGIKIDVKCRGGEKDFEEGYLGLDGFRREAKHNLFARQLFDENLDADVFLLTHLKRPNKKPSLPGRVREKSWRLFICGWISKKRALKEAVYVPPGGITEQGNKWFPYQYHNFEIYNKNLNGLKNLKDLLDLDKNDVLADENREFSLNLTSVDTYRIISDLIGRRILNASLLDFVKKEFSLDDKVKPVLHPNQYFHLFKWLKLNKKISDKEVRQLSQIMNEEKFTGL